MAHTFPGAPGNFRAEISIPLSLSSGEHNISFYATDSEGAVSNIAERKFAVQQLTVSTRSVSDITYNSATVFGNITESGVTAITSNGFCFGTSENPTTSDNVFSISPLTSPGEIISFISGLSPDTTYYVRVFAQDEELTAYGENITFRTSELPKYTVYFDSNGGTAVSGVITSYSIHYTKLYDFKYCRTKIRCSTAYSINKVCFGYYI